MNGGLPTAPVHRSLGTAAGDGPGGEPKAGQRAGPNRGRWILAAIIAVCIAPVIASYLSYYLVRPDGRTNYGDLLDPQVPVAATVVRTADGQAGSLGQWRGKWLMVSFGREACDPACAHRLYLTRQIRLTTGKDRDRVERLLLMADGSAPPAPLIDEHPGLNLLRVDAASTSLGWPAEPGRRAEDHIYLVDPLGNLMMRFPADADPNRMKKDLGKLLKASRVG